MTRVGSMFGTAAKAIALLTGHALCFLCMALWAPNAHAYPLYDDGAGKGCVQCHNGFQGGNGPLHFQHRTQLGITTCNVCHSEGGGSTPVRTYWSGSGGGFGCAGVTARTTARRLRTAVSRRRPRMASASST